MMDSNQTIVYIIDVFGTKFNLKIEAMLCHKVAPIFSASSSAQSQRLTAVKQRHRDVS